MKDSYNHNGTKIVFNLLFLHQKVQILHKRTRRSYERQHITLPGNAYLIKKYFYPDLSLLTHGVGRQFAKY